MSGRLFYNVPEGGAPFCTVVLMRRHRVAMRRYKVAMCRYKIGACQYKEGMCRCKIAMCCYKVAMCRYKVDLRGPTADRAAIPLPTNPAELFG